MKVSKCLPPSFYPNATSLFPPEGPFCKTRGVIDQCHPHSCPEMQQIFKGDLQPHCISLKASQPALSLPCKHTTQLPSTHCHDPNEDRTITKRHLLLTDGTLQSCISFSLVLCLRLCKQSRVRGSQSAAQAWRAAPFLRTRTNGLKI